MRRTARRKCVNRCHCQPVTESDRPVTASRRMRDFQYSVISCFSLLSNPSSFYYSPTCCFHPLFLCLSISSNPTLLSALKLQTRVLAEECTSFLPPSLDRLVPSCTAASSIPHLAQTRSGPLKAIPDLTETREQTVPAVAVAEGRARRQT